MKYTTLSTTDVRISCICLGTMSYGHQVDEADGHAQLDYALTQGVNFIDTAEMYPIPPQESTYGTTETFIGRWLQKTGKRKDIVLASKIAGPNRYAHLRDGKHRFIQSNIEQAVDASLKRLKTDYLDLFQLHWPDRNVNYFGQRGYVHDENAEMTPFIETLKALETAVKAGKVRYVGISNETPWGTMEFLRIAKENNLPRMVSVQNVYNLINRHYEISMAEVSMHENIGLLAYSPLAYGVLGGGYLGGNVPPKGRLVFHPQFAARYRTSQVAHITQMYADVAKKHGLTLAQMSLAFVNRQPFVTSTIIGASTMQQLKEDIASIDVELTDDVLKDIEAVHEQFPNVVA